MVDMETDKAAIVAEVHEVERLQARLGEEKADGSMPRQADRPAPAGVDPIAVMYTYIYIFTTHDTIQGWNHKLVNIR